MDKKEEPQKPVEEEEEEIDDDEEEDMFNKRIENSGCSKQHYELQVYLSYNFNYFLNNGKISEKRFCSLGFSRKKSETSLLRISMEISRG